MSDTQQAATADADTAAAAQTQQATQQATQQTTQQTTQPQGQQDASTQAQTSATDGQKVDAAKTAADQAADAAKDQVAGKWPESWREDYAKGDDKLLKQLQRYASPQAALDALFAAKTRISRGEIAKVLGDNPTEAEIKEYREANGIPEKPADYKIELGEGRVIGDVDKPFVDAFLEKAHKANTPPKLVNQIMDHYFDAQELGMAMRYEKDLEAKKSCEDELRAEWGPEFRANHNLVGSMLGNMPNGAGQILANARGPDGTPVMSNPAIIRWMTQMGRELNPEAALVPGAGSNAGKAIEDEIASINAMIADPVKSKAYYGDEKLQARYRELLDVQERMKKSA